MVKHMKQILHHLGWNMLKHVEPCWTHINNGLVGTDRLVQDFATIHSTCPVMENQTYGIRWQSDNPNFFHEEVVIFELQAATFSITSGLQVCFDVEAAQEDGVRSAEASVSWMASRWCYCLNPTWGSSLSVLMRIQEIDLDLRESRSRKPWFLPVKYRGIL